ncbi:MAG: YihY/virulence factor BrkB family protein [Haliea sp.]|nr:MAG: YihY/virulence factor BrkB family protein [Haliea sp.]
MDSPLTPSHRLRLSTATSRLLARFPLLGKLVDILQKPFKSIYRAVTLWIDADGLRMSAAMSFYGILSLAPLLVLLVAVMGWWLDRTYIETQLIGQIQEVIGAQGAQVLRQALDSAQRPSEGIIASVLASGFLLVGATGVFAELQNAFERLWRRDSGVAPAQKWWYSASLRLRGVAYILAFGFLLLVSLAISTFLSLLSGWAGSYLPMEKIALVINEAVSFGFCAMLFVALMRMSAGPKPQLRFLAFGAAVGAVLFAAGKHVMAIYLSTAAVVSAYGAAGSLVVILMWLYFSSAVLLFAASCARVLAEDALARADALLHDGKAEVQTEVPVLHLTSDAI